VQKYSLTHLRDDTIARNLKELDERGLTTKAALLAHLAEFEERRLHVPAAFPSLLEYCTGYLGWHREAALKRIRAARTARQYPAIFEAIEKGRLHISSIVLLRPHLTTQNVDELIQASSGKSKSEVEQLLATRSRPTLDLHGAWTPSEPSPSSVPDSDAPCSGAREQNELESSPVPTAERQQAEQAIATSEPVGTISMMSDGNASGGSASRDEAESNLVSPGTPILDQVTQLSSEGNSLSVAELRQTADEPHPTLGGVPQTADEPHPTLGEVRQNADELHRTRAEVRPNSEAAMTTPYSVVHDVDDVPSAGSNPSGPSPLTLSPPPPPAKSSRGIPLHITMDEEMRNDLEYARELLSHSVPYGSTTEILRRALKALIRLQERRKCGSAAKRRHPGKALATRGRHIPAAIRIAVWRRDEGRCAFVSPDGRRCKSRRRLEFDHIHEYARGGPSTVENLRLLCRVHNQHAAEQSFGRDFMKAKRGEKGANGPG
jgi:hypothetical protein